MKFGKHIQSQQYSEWSAHYLDYKGLKKFISKLLKMSSDELAKAGLLTGSAPDDDRAKLLQSQKAAFFFKLERELEKINSFYLQKENELKIRLRTLIDKKKILQSDKRRLKHAYTLLNAIQEAFAQFEQELDKIQKYVELNNEGFRKILKKWDKRSKSSTKELYLSRQIDIQPCFNTQFLSELADLASANRLELLNIQSDIPADDVMQIDRLPVSASATTTTMASSLQPPKSPMATPTDQQGADVMDDLELELVKAVSNGQSTLVRDILDRNVTHKVGTTSSSSGPIAAPTPSANVSSTSSTSSTSSAADELREQARLSRVFWHACSEGSDEIVAMLIDTQKINYAYVDDINERSCLHVAAMKGRQHLMQACADHGANVRASDVYGRTPLHYATMNGFSDCVSFLLSKGADIETRDHDGFTPLIYAIMNGHTSCVQLLLDAGASVEPAHDSDHVPLSLACHCGHKEIALLLYHRGAKNIPNAESLYPLHIAARQGHEELCRLLSRPPQDVDVPDKYSSWTPLFWAASDGHLGCVRILIDAGAKVNTKDENGKTPLYYAAWEGHMDIVQLLIDAGGETDAHAAPPMLPSMGAAAAANAPPPMPLASSTPSSSSLSAAVPMPMSSTSSVSTSPSQMVDTDTELDTIPSLSLPPPIIPFRIYGHNYLDRKYQVQITLRQRPIRMFDNSQISSLRLVISSNPDTGMIPHSVILPCEDREIINFQVDKLDDFFLEFDIFATFGSKVIGRGVALPLTFNGADFKIKDCQATLPLLDSHLKVIGQLTFGFSVVKPFRGVQLEIGGRIETYWKSTNTVLPPSHPDRATPEPTAVTTPTLTGGDASAPSSINASSSAGGSASGPSALPSSSSGLASFITASSLSGDYVRAVVQLTKDGVPVIFANWLLDYDGLTLPISDITFAQFQSLGAKLLEKHKGDANQGPLCPITGNSRILQSLKDNASFLSLEDIFNLLPSHFGLHIELKYPSVTDLKLSSFANIADRNSFVDTILQCIYDFVRSLPPEKPNIRIFFSSFNPAICTVVNWKQPNYSVFYNACCGLIKSNSQRGAKRKLDQDQKAQDDDHEQQVSGPSLKEAVKFAKRNNLLGIISEASLLVQVPSLIKTIKESGLILVTSGEANDNEQDRRIQERFGVDAMIINQVIHFNTTMAGAGF